MAQIETAERTTEPWHSQPAWRDNRIASTARGELGIAWTLATLFTLASLPILVFLPDEIDSGNHAAWIALVFPLAAFGLLLNAWRKTRGWRRFGRLALSLDPFPGSLGGDFGGSLEIPLPYDPRRRFEAALACSRITDCGSGSDRGPQERVIWDRSGLAESQAGLQGTTLRFRFELLADLPESEAESDDYRRWSLRLREQGAKPGRGFDRLFVVPVFATQGQRSRARIKESHETLAAAPAPDFPARSLRMTRDARHLELTYPPFRNWPGLAIIALFGLLCLGVGVAIGLGALEYGLGSLFALFFTALLGFMSLVFGLVGLLVAALGIGGLGHGLSVTADRDGITARHSVFGIPTRREAMAASAIREITGEVGMRAGRGAGSKAYKRLIARDSTGGRVTLADGIADPAVLRRIEAAVTAVTGYPKQSDGTDAGANR